jgi:hypothetical protein
MTVRGSGRREELQRTTSAPAVMSSNTQCAYSDTIIKLNSITSMFIEKQKHIAESTGFKLFAKPLHPLLFDRQFQVWLMPKVDTMGRAMVVNSGRSLLR